MSSKPMSRAQRQAAFLQAATHIYEQLETWYDQHPAATFGEIETEVRRRRRELMGEALTLLINGRTTGYQFEPPRGPECQPPMEFEGYRAREIYGLEGDSELQRAYYVCSECDQQTLFPPRPPTAPAGRSLE